jgi:signal transduction histidine kinase
MKRRICTFFLLLFCCLLRSEAHEKSYSLKEPSNAEGQLVVSTVRQGDQRQASLSPEISGMSSEEGSVKDVLLYTMLFSTSVLLLLTTTLTIGRKRMRAINDELKAKNAEIRNKNHALRELHTRSRLQNEAMDDQRKALEEMNRVKDKMFSIIAHDFRSPLNTIQGVLNLLHLDVLTPEELRNMLPHLSQKVDHSISLLDNLLNWARTQMNGLKINIIAFPLAPEIDETIGILSQLANQKSIRIEKDIESESLVHADPDMIQLVVRNLLSNAIKFTMPGGLIRVSTEQKDGLVTISVSDNGVGISKEVMEKLFTQTGYSTKGTSQEKGTGLGLALCGEFVRRNGGEIWVESGESEGATFHFTVPVAEMVQEPSYS